MGWFLLAAIVLALLLLFHRLALLAWLGATATLLLGWRLTGVAQPALFNAIVLALVASGLLFGLPPLRRALLSGALMRRMDKVLPKLGDTERVALEAGTVWWDRDLFSGAPQWQKLFDTRLPALSEREQAFLDGPVEELCRLLDDWQVHQLRDLPPEIWQRLGRDGFFGMIIPQQYGGLEFSAIAQSRVVTKLSSRSVAAAVTVMVPNSLGPAELLLHYGSSRSRCACVP